ncbi:hypothetical protein QO647_004430 [Salmonella enterica]|nr:hypothetical protein [Salmonella enterica]ELU4002642.1 hypothetical protein [Salmonella enterica]
MKLSVNNSANDKAMFNRNKIVQIKRLAVKTMFWPACPIDDDYCYDRIMKADMIDKAFQDQHAIYVHDAYKSLCTTDSIKKAVRKAAIQLVVLMGDVTPEVAETILNKWDTTESVNGTDTVGSYDYLLR